MAIKTIYTALLILLISPHVWGAKPISIDDFEKITNEDDRRIIIDQAPPEQKEELKKLDLHMGMLSRWGGETGFKIHKETCITRVRGLGCLENVFAAYLNIRESYIAGVMITNEKAGTPLEQRQEIERTLREEEKAVNTESATVHSLVYSLAASPNALALNKSACKLADALSNRTVTNGSAPYHLITKEERIEADQQMHQIYDKLQKLPKLTPAQLQSEYNAFTDQQVAQWQ
jgi:hypothetical protein